MSTSLIETCARGIQKNAKEAIEDLNMGMVRHAMENLKKCQADTKMAISECRHYLKAQKVSIKKKKNLF